MGVLKFRFLASLLLSNVVVYVSGNLAAPCNFCARERGWPLTYYVEEGIVGDAHYVWSGLLGDVAVSVGAGMLLTLLWCYVAQASKAPADEVAATGNRRRVR